MALYDFNGLTLRVVQIDGEPWFLFADLRVALDLSSSGTAMAAVNPDEKRIIPRGLISGKGMNQAKLVSESGLYKLITRSDKAEAKPFQEWLTRDVLPSIRKNGSYRAKAIAFCMAS